MKAYYERRENKKKFVIIHTLNLIVFRSMLSHPTPKEFISRTKRELIDQL